MPELRAGPTDGQEEGRSMTSPKVGDTWYRYEDRSYCSVDEHENVHGYTCIDELSFEVIKVTPKGVWLSAGSICRPRFVLLKAHKRFACSSKQEAMASLVARKERQVRIMRSQLNQVEKTLADARYRLAHLNQGESSDRAQGPVPYVSMNAEITEVGNV